MTPLRFLFIFVFLCTRSFLKKSLKGVCTSHNCLHYGKVSTNSSRWHKPIISIFRIFLRKVIESSFWCKFISFGSCARAYETWKQCQWIMRTLTCKHIIAGKNWLYFRPYLKVFPVFNVLETCREYLLTIDLQIVEFIKKFIERFFEKCKICRHGPN